MDSSLWRIRFRASIGRLPHSEPSNSLTICSFSLTLHVCVDLEDPRRQCWLQTFPKWKWSAILVQEIINIWNGAKLPLTTSVFLPRQLKSITPQDFVHTLQKWFFSCMNYTSFICQWIHYKQWMPIFPKFCQWRELRRRSFPGRNFHNWLLNTRKLLRPFTMTQTSMKVRYLLHHSLPRQQWDKSSICLLVQNCWQNCIMIKRGVAMMMPILRVVPKGCNGLNKNLSMLPSILDTPSRFWKPYHWNWNALWTTFPASAMLTWCLDELTGLKSGHPEQTTSKQKRSTHNRFDHSVRRMVATKRILLFPEMLEDAGYYDPQSMRHLHEGSSHGWRSWRIRTLP